MRFSIFMLPCALLVLGLSEGPRTSEVTVVNRNDAFGPGGSPDGYPRFDRTEAGERGIEISPPDGGYENANAPFTTDAADLAPEAMLGAHAQHTEHTSLPNCRLNQTYDMAAGHIFSHLTDLVERNQALRIDTITPITFAWQTLSQIDHAIVICAFGPPKFVATASVTTTVGEQTVDCFPSAPIAVAGCVSYRVLVEPMVLSPALFVSFVAATGDGNRPGVARPAVQAAPMPALLARLEGGGDGIETLAALLEEYRTDNHNIAIVHQLLFSSVVLGHEDLTARVLRYAYEPYRHRGRVLAESLATRTETKLPGPLESSCERPREAMDKKPLRYHGHVRSPPSALVLASFPLQRSKVVVDERTFSSVSCGGQSGDSSACLFERVCIGPGRRVHFYSHGHEGCESDWQYSYIGWHGREHNFSEQHVSTCRAGALPLDARMVPGRTLLWEAVPGLSGHDSQFSGKLRQDLTDFPSEIHHVLWSPFIKMTGHNIDMLRVSFGDINFNIPPIYAPDDSQFASGQITCFSRGAPGSPKRALRLPQHRGGDELQCSSQRNVRT
jgi:hypothetical protein